MFGGVHKYDVRVTTYSQVYVGTSVVGVNTTAWYDSGLEYPFHGDISTPSMLIVEPSCVHDFQHNRRYGQWNTR